MVLSIANVAEETGIAKEVLRKWEARYGFPVPGRDALGDRVYSPEQLARLKKIKKLIDDGMRPGQVVPLDDSGLEDLLTSVQAPPVSQDAAAAPVVGWLQSRNTILVYERLRAELVRIGLRAFVLESLPHMNEAVGLAWASGAVDVHDEHLYTQVVTGLVLEALPNVVNREGHPRVLLTTPPGELHTLGILMAEAVLSIAGAHCVSLGAQTPLAQLQAAAQRYGADIVGLSFSAAYPKRKIIPVLKEVRASLPAEVRLWAGGAGVRGLEPAPRGVVLFDHIAGVEPALEKYRGKPAE